MTKKNESIEMDKKPTACNECKHLLSKNSRLKWYDLCCKAVENPKVLDPLTGIMEYLCGQKYKYIRSVNDGDCEHFEKRKNMFGF